jgi:transcription-repair coupling factor (superfamily II helicase)
MYQKILDEAMEELHEEVGNKQLAIGNEIPAIQKPVRQDAFPEARNFVRDCVIDTDLSILIPDAYVENITERVSLYQQLDNSKTEEDLIAFEKQLQDRFGEIPVQTKKLISVVRLRWLAIELGFEKLILKNGKLTAWFISNKKSPYYQTEIFSRILQFVQNNPKTCSVNEGENKLALKIENIIDVEKAIAVLNKMK